MTTCGLLRTLVKTELSSHPQATTVCFNWYFQQSAIISFKSVKRFRLYNEDCLCLLWGMNCVFIYRRIRGKDLWKPWRHCGVEVQLHPFLTSALYWDERSASYLNFFTCWIHGTHWIGSCAELRLKKIQNPCPCRDTKLHSPVVQSVAWSPYELRHPYVI